MKKYLLTIVLAIYLIVCYKLNNYHNHHYDNATITETIDIHLHNIRKEDFEKMIGKYDGIDTEVDY